MEYADVSDATCVQVSPEQQAKLLAALRAKGLVLEEGEAAEEGDTTS